MTEICWYGEIATFLLKMWSSVTNAEDYFNKEMMEWQMCTQLSITDMCTDRQMDLKHYPLWSSVIKIHRKINEAFVSTGFNEVSIVFTLLNCNKQS